MSGFVIALYPIAKLCTSERKLSFYGGGEGEGSQLILMHKGGIFMLVANNVMVGCYALYMLVF